MRHKWRCTVPAILLAMVMVLGMAVQYDVHAAIDLGQRCSLTINTGTDREELDLEDANVVIDLYKVAGAAKVEGYDTYGYSEIAAYSALTEKLSDTRSLDSQAWRGLAEQAAEITLTSGQTIEKAASGVAGTAITDLDTGLYLVVAHGADLTDYVETVTDEATGDSHIVTIANSKEYKFSFAPELLSLPVTTSEEIGPETIMNTADASVVGGEGWVYDAKAVLKYSYENRFGNLEITKTLEKKEGTTNPMFVFDIEAELDGENVYSNVVALQFDNGGLTKKALIEDKIPVGATVTVTEQYTGTSYKLVAGDKTQTVVIPEPKENAKASVSFTNTYNPDDPNPPVVNGGIDNKFKYSEGNWNVDNRGDNSADAN